MAQENIEIVSRTYDAFASRNFGDAFEYAVFTVQGGKITRMRVFLDRAEAVEAVGLAE